MRPLAAKIASEKETCANCDGLFYDREMETETGYTEAVRLCRKCFGAPDRSKADHAEMGRSQTRLIEDGGA